MTTRDLTAIFNPSRPAGPAERDYRVPDWLTRYTPSQGWDTYLLFLLIFATVAWTINDANWVDTPGILMLVVAATLVGLGFAKLRVPAPLLHVVAVAPGRRPCGVAGLDAGRGGQPGGPIPRGVDAARYLLRGGHHRRHQHRSAAVLARGPVRDVAARIRWRMVPVPPDERMGRAVSRRHGHVDLPELPPEPLPGPFPGVHFLGDDARRQGHDDPTQRAVARRSRSHFGDQSLARGRATVVSPPLSCWRPPSSRSAGQNGRRRVPVGPGTDRRSRWSRRTSAD